MSNDTLLSIPPGSWDERREPREDDRQAADAARDDRMAIRVRFAAADIIHACRGQVITAELAVKLAAQIQVVVVGELLARRGR